MFDDPYLNPFVGIEVGTPTFEEQLWRHIDDSLSVAAGFELPDDYEGRELVVDSKPDISLAEYMQRAWRIVDPANPLVWNWHLELMCRALEEVSLGKRNRLIINVPPGMSKSMTVCVMWPTWEWTWLPTSRWLFYSFNEQFSTRDAVRSRRLIQSRWYQRRWGGVFTLTTDQNEKKRYENNKTGFRMVSGFGGSVTGERGDRIVIDDPIKASEARNENKLAEVNQVFDEAISSRTNQPTKSAIVLIMQRVSARDLAGHNLARGGWDHLSIPMEYEPLPEEPENVPPELRNWSNMPGFDDPRTTRGELLDPARFPRDVVEREKVTLGGFAAAAQFQQRPVPAGGGIFKMEWFKFWEPHGESHGPVRLMMDDGTTRTVIPTKRPNTFTGVLQSHDLTFSGSTSAAVSDVYGWSGNRVFLLDELRTFGDFTSQVAQIRELTKRWPIAALKLIEAKANGQAAIATLRTTIPGLVPVPVTEGSKPERYDSVSPFVEAGHVYIPHPDMPGFAWVRDWITEVCSAPFGTYDDRADTLYMALARIFLHVAAHAKPRVGTRVVSNLGM